jgi:hypothetical protein
MQPAAQTDVAATKHTNGTDGKNKEIVSDDVREHLEDKVVTPLPIHDGVGRLAAKEQARPRVSRRCPAVSMRGWDRPRASLMDKNEQRERKRERERERERDRDIYIYI